MPKIRTTNSFSFPIFCTLLIVYSLLQSLPNQWLSWAFIAVILDLIINPIYVRSIEEVKDNAHT